MMLRRLPTTFAALLLFFCAVANEAGAVIIIWGDADAVKAERNERQMAAAYEAILSALPDDQKPAFRAAQDRWKAYHETACAFEAGMRTRPSQQFARIAIDLVALDCRGEMARKQFSHLKRFNKRLGIGATIEQAPRGSAAESCKLIGLPAEFNVQAVADRNGLNDTDHQLDQSGTATRATEVIVNHPGRPVVLVLAAGQPIVWKIRRTRGTSIAGVIVTSLYPQALLGIEKTVPTLFALGKRNTTGAQRSPCRPFPAFQAGRKLDALNQKLRTITGRQLSGFVVDPLEGRFYVGTAEGYDPAQLVYSTDYSIKDYTSLPPQPAGLAGLERLIRDGKIRQATPEDIEGWVSRASDRYRHLNQNLRIQWPQRYAGAGRAYVILDKVTLPNGLNGRSAALFIVGDKAPRPEGGVRHLMFMWMKTGECTRGLKRKCY